MRSTQSIALVSACVLLPAACVVDVDRSDRADARAVQITRDGSDRCLGTAVSNRWVLTAKHCVASPGFEPPDAADRLHVRSTQGLHEVVDVEVLGGPYQHLGELSGRDLALLAVTPSLEVSSPIVQRSNAPLQIRALRSGEPVSAPLAKLGADHFYTDGVTCEGDSGGPAFTATGMLVGVASWRTAGACGSGLSVFTRVDAHLEWLALWLMLPARGSADAEDSSAAPLGLAWLRNCRFR